MCFFTKKWSPKLIFLNDFFFEKIPSIFDIENWLWKYGFGTFWQTINHCRIVLKQFPLSMLILGQKSCILGPTIFKIPQPNCHYYLYLFCHHVWSVKIEETISLFNLLLVISGPCWLLLLRHNRLITTKPKNIKLQCISVTKFQFYTIFIKRLIAF